MCRYTAWSHQLSPAAGTRDVRPPRSKVSRSPLLSRGERTPISGIKWKKGQSLHLDPMIGSKKIRGQDKSPLRLGKKNFGKLPYLLTERMRKVLNPKAKPSAA